MPIGEQRHEGVGLHISPDPISFGSLCEGYVYSMEIKLHNHTNSSIRIKASCSSCLTNNANDINVSYLPIQMAPGMTTGMTIRIYALNAGTSRYTLTVSYGLYEKSVVEKDLTAFILPVDLYKSLTKQLAVNKKKIQADNVTTLSRLGPSSVVMEQQAGSQSIEASTVYTASLLDTEDVDELSDLPSISYCYWDADKKTMFLDKKLCEVCFWSLNMVIIIVVGINVCTCYSSKLTLTTHWKIWLRCPRN